MYHRPLVSLLQETSALICCFVRMRRDPHQLLCIAADRSWARLHHFYLTLPQTPSETTVQPETRDLRKTDIKAFLWRLAKDRLGYLSSRGRTECRRHVDKLDREVFFSPGPRSFFQSSTSIHLWRSVPAVRSQTLTVSVLGQPPIKAWPPLRQF